MTGSIRGKIAAPDIAIPSLSGKRPTHGRQAPVRLTAEIHALPQYQAASHHAIPSNDPFTQFRATGPARVLAIGATKAFVGRQTTLVESNREQGQFFHHRV
jgi:hypothetical protein